ncbi:MAG: ribonuclease D [Bernardetiaceae bacterium]
MLIQTSADLQTFCTQALQQPWLTFDSEFVGEKYYKDRLCVISAGIPNQSVVIDALTIPDLTPFLRLLEDSRLRKITHAGENDYRILIQQYGLRPRNLFDTQLVAAFLDDHYPASLQNLLRIHLDIRLSKASTVSDWEARPLRKEQITYALDDVNYLPQLADTLSVSLQKRQRLEWALSECATLEDPQFYQAQELDKELHKKWVRELPEAKAIFLWRLLQWRENLAQSQDQPRKRILSDDRLRAVVQLVGRNRRTVESDRRIPPPLIKKHWETFEDLLQNPPTPEEKALIQRSRQKEKSDSTPQREALLDTLYNLIKYRATEVGISPEVIISRRELNRMKKDIHYLPPNLQEGWRREVLGDTLLRWLQTDGTLRLSFEGERCILDMITAS